MAAPTNTFLTGAAVGIREDLTDIIYRIDPTETPFTSMAGRTVAYQRYHEWQIQHLAAANPTNASLEGNDATANVATPTVRVGNRTQIVQKTAFVSGTLEAVRTAGRGNEMEYQVLLKGLEIKRDIEASMIQNNASQIDNGTVANIAGSFESWLVTNTSRGTSGANGGFSGGLVAAPTDGTTRAFTEAMLKTVMASVFTAGGKPSVLMVDPTQKQTFSSFAGIASTRYVADKPEMAAIIGAADVYVSDFGQLAVIPNIFQRHRSALIISPKFVKLAFLRPIKNWPLAKSGDADKRQVLGEVTLEMANEAAHGIVADLT